MRPYGFLIIVPSSSGDLYFIPPPPVLPEGLMLNSRLLLVQSPLHLMTFHSNHCQAREWRCVSTSMFTYRNTCESTSPRPFMKWRVEVVILIHLSDSTLLNHPFFRFLNGFVQWNFHRCIVKFINNFREQL